MIDKGAQIEEVDKDWWTPLHYAASRGHLEVVRLLCDRGADIEAHDDYGWRPLHESESNDQKTISCSLFSVQISPF